ncbi:hypothetical protein [Burkholderia cenocepacia]|uniref:hypothetical protein n=1 Tax=Burkholderia cenocepacia TaxID=95486 RepID=UPI001E37C1DE|nr:hypothetical protein [Burkholderia cenocepacia]
MAVELELAVRAFAPSAIALFAPLTTVAAWPIAVEPVPADVAPAPMDTAPVFAADDARPSARASSIVADA